MWAIVQRHPGSVVALAEAAGVPLPEHDQVAAGPDSHPMRQGDPVYTDGSVRLLRKGVPVFFASVEVQRKYEKGKYATLPLADAKLPLGARALPAALADFRANPPRTRAMLDELERSDLTLANLYLRAIVEEIPYTMLGEVLRSDMRDKLRTLEWFREYEAEIEAKAAEAAEAKIAEAAKAAEAEAAEAAKAAAQEAATAKAETEAAATATTIVTNLTEFLLIRGDKPTAYAIKAISACRDAELLATWLTRAYLGETSAQLFPEG
ncbi:MAG: hypothetical protein ACRDNS_04440 [Trebonia sp.]